MGTWIYAPSTQQGVPHVGATPTSGPGEAPAVAGTWYPGDAATLRAQVEQMLAAAKPWSRETPPRALIVPHAGLRYSGPTAAHGFVALKPQAFDRVVVLAPSHREPLWGAAIDPSAAYETPLGSMCLDSSAIEMLAAQSHFTCSAKPFAREHAIELQLPFLQIQLPTASLVPVLVGEMDPKGFAAVANSLRPLWTAQTLFVVSSDFMHFGAAFGYVPFADRIQESIREYDSLAIAAIQQPSFEEFQSVLESTQITICGRNPLRLLQLVPPAWSAELLAYTTSGEITGDFSHSVSYATIAFSANGKDAGATDPAAPHA